MWHVTSSAAGRALAYGSSLLFHASVVLTIGGHTDTRPALAPASVAIELITAPDTEPVVPQLAAALPPPRGVARVHTHRHSYPVARDHDARPHDPALVHPPHVLQRDVPAFVLTVPASPRATDSRSEPRRQLHALPAAALSSTHASAAEADGQDASSTVQTPARLLSGRVPAYPREAAEASVEAEVALEIVVDPRGHVLRARVLQPIGYGLDAAATRAILAYRFSPALRDGQPIAVRMRWTMSFRLQ